MEVDLKLLGVRIRNARKLRQMTLDEVAAQVGVNKSTVQRYEKGAIRTPKVPVIRAMAGTLGVNYDWLTGENPDMEPVDGDEETTNYLRLLEERPELRALLKTAKGANSVQVQAVVAFLTALRSDD